MSTPIQCVSNYILTNEGYLVLKKSKAWIIRLFLASLICTSLFVPKEVASSYMQYTPIVQEQKEDKLLKVIKTDYKVGDADAKQIVESTFRWAAQFHLDPALVLGVIATESSFNKFAISPVGALGLMQFMPKWHVDKMKKAREEVGTPEVFDIDANIFLGSWILKDCIKKTKTLNMALRCYEGSENLKTGYDQTVLTNKKVFDNYI